MHPPSTSWRAVAPLLIVGLSLSACVTQRVQQVEPHWVRRGEGVFWDVAAIYGVGTSATGNAGDTPTDAQPMKVLKPVADERAQAQVETILVVYVDQLFQDALLAGGDAADEIPAIQAAILSEGVIVDRWIDPFSQAVYSLFRIDRRRIPQAIMTAGQRDAAGRRRLAAQADAIFERLRPQGEAWK